MWLEHCTAEFKVLLLKLTAAMSSVIRKLERHRAARERAARELAQSLVEIEADDDDDDERERVQRVLHAWEALEALSVDASECDLAKSKPAGGWPVVCKIADTTDPALVALQQRDDIKKILQAGKKAMRTLRVPTDSITHADRTEYYGKSVVGYVIGCKGDGTPGMCVAFQKTINYLHDLDGNYAGSMELRCGLEGTLGMQHCFVIPMAIVKAEDRCLGEGSLFGAMVHATGYHLVGQCTMPGAPDVWAPNVRELVLADDAHDLFECARLGVAPPMMAPQSSEERSKSTKEGKKNMSVDAKKREADFLAKCRKKHGCGMPGKQHRACSTEVAVLAQTKGFTYTLFIAEALECIRDKRDPAAWANKKLTKRLLKRVADAGLAQFEFWTELPEEKDEGVQGFDIEGFELTKDKDKTQRGAHVWDWVVHTQRGPFPVYDVSVALRIFGENEAVPKLPWGAGVHNAPVAVKELIERALAWSPPASEPSPPPAKKPRARAAPPRRSSRLKK